MPIYYHHKKPPSRLRCLKHLYWPAVAAMIGLAYPSVMDTVCVLFTSLATQGVCPSAQMPVPLFWTLAAVFIYGFVASVHRAYRDYYKGDLLWEYPGS